MVYSCRFILAARLQTLVEAVHPRKCSEKAIAVSTEGNLVSLAEIEMELDTHATSLENAYPGGSTAVGHGS